MHFKQFDLQQLTPEYLHKLSAERLAILCDLLRQDLISARDALNQNPSNSSRPPSTRAPWERSSEKEKEVSAEIQKTSDAQEQQEAASGSAQSTTGGKRCENHQSQKQPAYQEPKRKPGKQKGAPGYGRTQQ